MFCGQSRWDCSDRVARTPVGLVSIRPHRPEVPVQSSGARNEALHGGRRDGGAEPGTGWLQFQHQDRQRANHVANHDVPDDVDNDYVGNHLGSGSGAQLHHRRLYPGQPHPGDPSAPRRPRLPDHRPAGARRLAAASGKLPRTLWRHRLHPARRSQRSPTIVAILSKLTGDIDPAKVLHPHPAS